MVDDDDLRWWGGGGHGTVGGNLILRSRNFTTAANHRQDDALADALLLEPLDRCRVDRENGTIDVNQREQDILTQSRMCQLDDVAKRESVSSGSQETNQRSNEEQRDPAH